MATKINRATFDGTHECWELSSQEYRDLNATLQAKDAQIAALTEDRDNWRSRALEDTWPFEWQVASELREALLAKDAQIERLAKLLERAQATTQFRALYEEFDAAITRRCVDDQACIFADELQAAIKEATDD